MIDVDVILYCMCYVINLKICLHVYVIFDGFNLFGGLFIHTNILDTASYLICTPPGRPNVVTSLIILKRK